MGGDKHGQKSGRYVGGFLQLFDWNAKSRKKLFPSKSDLPEQMKPGKTCDGNLAMSRMRVVEDEEYAAGLSIKGGSEYSYASSITDDDVYGAKPPGVVARLMGLDSLPTFNVVDPYPDLFFDTPSLHNAPFRGQNSDLDQDQMMHSKIEMVSRPPKMPNRPFDKFQSEILPPKSAKTIPITHHKLLSPVRRHTYVPSQDAAHIMAAAARIIEPGPQTTPRAKISSAESSSVPFKVRELREKLESSQRPSHRQVESSAAKCLKGQPINKSWNGGTIEASAVKVSPNRDRSCYAPKSNGKSISLAIQAKVNVQKREGLPSSTSRSLASDAQDDPKSRPSFRDQTSSSKSSNRKSSTQSTSSVLRINHQKQNSPSYRDKSAKPTGRKTVTEDDANRRHRSLSKDGGTPRASSRKSSLQARDSDKGTPYSGPKNVPRKKRFVDGSLNFNKNQVTDNMFASQHENPSQSSMVSDRHLTWIEESRKKGMDVVSFTFTAPMTRSLPVSETCKQLGEKKSDLFNDDRSKTLTNSDISKLSSSPGFNGIRGDALSVLLEHKLKELASNLGSPHSFMKTSTGLESAHRAVFSPGSAESAIGKAKEQAAQRKLQVDCQTYSGLFTSEPQSIKSIFNFQAGEALEDYTDNTGTKQWSCHLPSPVSILEPSMLTESSYSSESLASSITEERKFCSSVSPQEVVGLNSVHKLHQMEIDMDTSDSASSTSSQMIAAKDSMKTKAWELGYVKNILCNMELMFKDYMTCQTHEVINPHLFDQLERRRGGTLMKIKDSKLDRKLLFDCVGEFLDMKCQWFVGGGFQMWMKGIETLKRKERLAAEIYKEVEGWRNLGKGMVDELVDKDMSSKYGRWLDFEVEEFVLGVEIEDQIVDSLVVELVIDLLPSRLLHFQ